MPLKRRFEHACILPHTPLEEALTLLHEYGLNTILVVDEAQRLQGIATDMDIRKALLKGISLDAPIVQMMNQTPLVGHAGMSTSELLEMLMEFNVETIPVINDDKVLVDWFCKQDFVEREMLQAPVVIMAGGFGRRLWPLTEKTPKPLLPVGNQPVLGHILDHLQYQGFQQVFVTTYYKSGLIERYIREESDHDLDISIIKEKEPLGTAGSLRQIPFGNYHGPILVMNGDILTRINFQEMIKWHQDHENRLTMGSRLYRTPIPFGVVEADGQDVKRITEKPTYTYNTNAGIYMVEHQALNHIPEGHPFHMTDLIESLLDSRSSVGTFPISEPWIDIGQHQDFDRVRQDYHQFITSPHRMPSRVQP